MKMLQTMLSRIMDGVKTPEGKIIAVLLAICLSLMTWNVAAISFAVSGDGAKSEAAEKVEVKKQSEKKAEEPAKQEASEPEPPKEAAAEPEKSAEPKEEAKEEPKEEPKAEETKETKSEQAAASDSADQSQKEEASAESEPASEQAADSQQSAPAADDQAAQQEEAAASDAAASAEAEATTEKEEEEEKDVPMPAQKFSGSAGGVSVSVSAPEGAFPEGTKMNVREVRRAAVVDAVESAIGSEATAIKAVDITFSYKGKEIEPKKSVSVSLTSDAIKHVDNPVVVHVDGGGGSVVGSAGTGSSRVSFSADSFSTYVIAGVAEDETQVELVATSPAGVEVSISTTTDVLPATTQLSVTDTKPSAEPIAAQTGQEIKDIQGINVKLTDAEGATVTPASAVSITVDGISVEGGVSIISDGGSFINVSGSQSTFTFMMTESAELVFASVASSHTVQFVVEDEDGSQEVVHSFGREAGESIGELPEAAFKEGYRFDGWFVHNEDGSTTEITADTVVDRDMVAYATFSAINIYNLKVEYYYTDPNGGDVVFATNIVGLDGANDLPKTIESPSNIYVGAQVNSEYPTYYPEVPSLTVTEDDLADADANMTILRRVQYVPFTATYDYVYYLKDLSGDGYTKIESQTVNGVRGSSVSAPVKTYAYADFERAESVVIEEMHGQEVPVYYTRKSFSVSYDTAGGSYVPPTLAPYGSKVDIAAETPTQKGYEFAGWYTDEALTKKAGATVTLDKDVTLYAKWEAQTVGYTVVFMKEKYDNSGGETAYVYDNSKTAKAKVGSEVVADDVKSLAKAPNGYELDSAKNANSRVTIASDGSSVIYVYFKLIRYTLTFNHRPSGYGSASLTHGGSTYTSNTYSINGVVLGQDISALWPTNVASGKSSYVFTGWKYTNTSGSTTTRVTKVTELTWELVAKASNNTATFNASYSSDVSSKAVEYWLQQPDGTYVADETLSQTFNSNGTLSAKDINGYSTRSVVPSGYDDSSNASRTERVWVEGYSDTYTFNGNGYDVGDKLEKNGHTYTVTQKTERSGWHLMNPYSYTAVCNEPGHYEDQTISSIYTYRFYYDRASYDIVYNNGGVSAGTKTGVIFGADISGSEYNFVPTPPADKEDYTWGGWYSDSSLNNKYTFNTMPGNNLSLYAKWIAPQYTITYDLQGGAGSFDINKTVDKNTVLDSPGAPTRAHYSFGGWWTEPDGGTPYDFNQPITADTTVYAHWVQATLAYTVHYYEEGTTNELRPDKVVSSPLLTFGSQVTESAVNIAGYLPSTSSQSISLDYDNDNNQITFYYSSTAKAATYTVNYVLMGFPNIHVRASEVHELEAGQSVVVVPARAIDGSYLASQVEGSSLLPADILDREFFPTDEVKELTVTSNDSDNVVTFYYTWFATSKVTVNYVDMTGQPIAGAEPVVTYVKSGDTFNVPELTLAGFTRDHSEDANGGRNKASYRIGKSGDPVTINVYYKKDLRIVANNKSKPYDGTALVSQGVGDLNVALSNTLRSGDSIVDIAFDGSQTDAGTSNTMPKNAKITRAGKDVTDYYKIHYVPGALTVTNTKVQILVEPDRWNDGAAYDGTPRTIGFRNLRDKPEGKAGVEINNEAYEAKYGTAIRDMVRNITLTKTDAGSYTIPASQIRAAITLPVDPNFDVTLNVRDGELTIPAATVTVKTESAKKAYDGTALTNGEIELTGIIEAEAEAVKATATGAQTEVGESSNSYSIDWGNVNPDNYTISEELGKLEVTANDDEVTIAAPSASKVYDGAALTAEQALAENPVGVTGLPQGFTVEATVEGSATNVGDEGVSSIAGYSIRNAQGQDATKSFTNVKTADGKLTIQPEKVTVEISGANNGEGVVYDGAAKTVEGYAVDQISNELYSAESVSLAEGVQANVSATDAGKVGMGLTAESFTNTNANFDVTFDVTDGYVRVNPAPVTVRAIANSKTVGQGDPEFSYEVEGLIGADAANAQELVRATVARAGNDEVVGVYPNALVPTVAQTTQGNYTVTNLVNGTFTIAPIGKLSVAATSYSGTYDGAAHGITASAGAADGQTTILYSMNYSADNPDAATWSEEAPAVTDATNVLAPVIVWVKATNPLYEESDVASAIIQIAPKAISVSASDAAVYDGQAKTLEITAGAASGLVEGETLTLTGAAVSGTDVGAYAEVSNYEWSVAKAGGADSTGNYTIAVAGNLSITPAAAEGIGLAVEGYNGTYDAQSHGVTASTTVAGTTLQYSTDNQAWSDDAPVFTDVVADQTVYVRASNPNYLTGIASATVTIGPAAITVAGGEQQLTYNGEFQTMTVTADNARGVMNGETLTLENATITGRDVATYEGVAPSVYTWSVAKADGSNSTDNYTIEVTGLLRIVKPDAATLNAAVSIQGWTYDGNFDAAKTLSATSGAGPASQFVYRAAGSDAPLTSAPVDAGDYTVEAIWPETTNYPPLSATANFTIAKRELNVTTQGGTKAFDGTALTNTGVTTEGFVAGEGAKVTATGSQTDVGTSNNTYAIDWNAAKEGNYTVTETLGTLEVTANDDPVNLVAPSAKKTYDGQALTADGTGEQKVTALGLPSGFTVRATATGTQTDAGSSANVVDDGFAILNAAGEDKTSSFTNVSKTDGTLEVTAKQVVVTTGGASKQYDGTPLTNPEATIEGLVAGETVDLTATGARTEMGVDFNGYSINWTGASQANYSIVENLGALEVTANTSAITLTAASDSKTYDGRALVNAAVTTSGLPAGFTVEATATGSVTDAGNSANVVEEGYVIKNAEGAERTSSFTNVQTVDGTLTVNPKPVTISTGTAQKPYDGTALVGGNAAISGLVEGETVQLSATGTVTEVDTATNTYDISWQGEAEGATAKKGNYTVTEDLGTLTVTANAAEVVLTAASASKTYDGTELADATVTATGLPANFRVDAQAEGSQTNAGSTSNVVAEGFVIRNAAGDDKTEYFTNVKTVDGTLTVGKRQVTLTSATAQKEYDGTALTDDTVTVSGDGWAAGEGATYEVTGSQTVAGASANTFTYTLNGAAAAGGEGEAAAARATLAQNYDITLVPGQLTVVNRSAQWAIAVEANSGEFTYDGTEHVVEGFKTLEFTQNGQAYRVEGVTARAAAANAGTVAVSVEGTPVVRDAQNNDVTAQFAVTTVPGTLTINKANVKLTSASLNKEFDGAALVNGQEALAEESGFAEGEGATYIFTGSQTLVGSSANAFTYTLNANTDADNYNITKTEGTLAVGNREQKYQITLVPNLSSVEYNGQLQVAEGFVETSFTLDGREYTVSGISARAEGVDVNAVQVGAASAPAIYKPEVSGTAVVHDANNNDVTEQFSVEVSDDGGLLVTPRQVTLVSADLNKEYDGVALVNGDAKLATETGFVQGEGASYTFTGSQTLAGNSANAFSYTLNAGTKAQNYTITKTEGTLTVGDRATRYALNLQGKSLQTTYDGTEKSVEGFETLTLAAPNGLLYRVEGATSRAAATDAVSITTEVSTQGYRVYDAQGNDVTTQFDVTATPGTLTIDRRVVTASVADAPDAMYDGAEHVGATDVVFTGLASGHVANIAYTAAAGTVPGDYAGAYDNATFAVTANGQDVTNNYALDSTAVGNLKITGRPDDQRYAITVVGASSMGNVYDGTAKTASGLVNNTFTVAGHEYTVEGLNTSDPVLTNAGSEANVVSGTPVVRDAAGNNVSAQFDVTLRNGALEVVKRPVTLTSGTASREYDGNALTNGDVTASTGAGQGFIEGEGATYTVTGSQTVAGSSDNLFTYALDEGTVADNYDITMVYGKLTVTNRAAQYQITVPGNAASVVYDGAAHDLSGVSQTTFTIDGNTYTVEGMGGALAASAYDAGEYTYNVVGTPVVRDVAGNDVSDQFNVVGGTGKLTITPRPVSLTSDSDDKPYDGTELTAKNVTASAGEGVGFVDGQGATYTYEGTQTIVGSSPNTFSYVLNAGTKAENYSVTTSYGTLTVSPLAEGQKLAITVKSNSANVLYDGNKHSVSGFDALTFAVGGATFAVEGLEAGVSGIDAGEYANSITGTALVRDAAGNDVTSQFQVGTEEGTLTIGKRSVTLRSASASKVYDGAALTAQTVAVEGDGFAAGEGAAYDVTGSQTLPGNSNNTFTYTLNANTKADNYTVADPAYGTLTVSSRAAAGSLYQIELVPNSLNPTYNGQEQSVSGFEQVTFEFDGHTYTVEGVTASAAGTDAGTYPVVVTGTPVVRDADGNDVSSEFAVTVAGDSRLVIGKRAIELTSASASKTYDGQVLTDGTVTVGGQGFVEGQGATYNVTGSQLVPGTSANAFTYALDEGTNAQNYTITTKQGTLTVSDRSASERFAITVRANSGNELYDGTQKTVEGFEQTTFTVAGNEFTVGGMDAHVDATDAGTYANVVSGAPVVRDAANNIVTGQFNVTTENGQLVVQKRTVVLTSATDSKQYDGNALTNGEVTVTGDGWAEGEGATYQVSGTRTLVGSSENTFTYTLGQNTKASNYNIRQALGTLTVVDRDAPLQIEVQANSGEFTYDGASHEVTGLITDSFTVDGNAYTVSGLNAKASATDVTLVSGEAASIPVNVTGTAIVSDAQGNNVTDQFAVGVAPGALTINPRPVTLTSASADKPYDGTALTADEVKVSEDEGVGFVAGQGATYNVTGAQTLVGSSENTFTYTLNNGTSASNYVVTAVPGTLTVNARSAADRFPVSVSANSGAFTYDGTAKTVEGYAASGAAAEEGVIRAASAEPTRFYVGGASFTVRGLEASATHSDVLLNNGAVGSYPVELQGTPVVVDSQGNDVTDQFAVTVSNGNLTINPKNIQVTTGSATKAYDGTPLTNVEADVDGLADGQNVIITTSGEQVEVGSSANSYSIEWGSVNSGNYLVSENLGSLEVTTNPTRITLTAPSATKAYDGQALVADGSGDVAVVAEGLPAGFTVDASASGSQTDAGSSENVVNEGFAILNSAGENKTANFTNVQRVAGTLTVDPAGVIVAANSATKVFGEADPEFAAAVSGLVGSDSVEYTVAREPGEEVGTYAITPSGEAVQGNYAVAYEPSTFIITAAAMNDPESPASLDDRFTIEGPADETYDGTAKEPGVIITDSQTGRELVEGVDYEVEYTDNVNAGMATVTIRGIGGYSGTITRTFTLYRAQLTIATPSATKVYDGQPLTATDGTFTGLVNGETASFEVTGSRVAVGQSTNDYRIVWDGTALQDNYQIRAENVSLGTLTVTAPPAAAETTTPEGGTPEGGTPEGAGAEGTSPEAADAGAGAGAGAGAAAAQAPTATPAAPAALPTPAETGEDGAVAGIAGVVGPAAGALGGVTEVLDDANPLAQSISDDGNPLGRGAGAGSLSLFDILATVLTVVLCAIMLVGVFGRRKKDDDSYESADAVSDSDEEQTQAVKRRRVLRIASVVPAVVAVVLLFVTQDFTAQFVIFDGWSVLFGIIALVQVLIMVLARKRHERNDGESGESGPAPAAA